MTYTKQSWADGPAGGTPISASRLNHIENGIAEANAEGHVSALAPAFNAPITGDATTALTSWLAALTPSTVGVLPPGSYTISAGLTLPANVTIEAYGATINVTGTPGPTYAITLANGSSIRGLTVADLRPNTSTTVNYGIRAASVSGFALADVTVTGFAFTGIVASASFDFDFRNVRVRNTGDKDDGAGHWYGDGIYISSGSHSFRLVDIDVRDNGRHGLFAWDSAALAASRFAAAGVVAEDNGDIGVCLTNVKDFTLTGVTAINNGINGGPFGGQGVQIVGSSTDHSLYGYGTLSGITVTDNKENGIELHYVAEVTISGFTGLRNTWAGLAVNDSDDITATGVTANNNGTAGVSLANAARAVLGGVSVRENVNEGVNITSSSSNVVLSGVAAYNNDQGNTIRSGITAAGASNVLVTGVITSDTQGSPTQDYGVRFFSVTGGEIRGVRGTGNAVRLVQVDGGSTNIVLDNPSDPSVDFGGRYDRFGLRDLSGAGAPEGIITAPIGSTYRRTDGGAGTSFYVKQTGTGNTGWVGK